MDGSKDLSGDASGIRPSDEMEKTVAQEDLDTSNSVVSAHQLEELPEKSITVEKIASEKPTRTSPRRPVTRSLSGRPAKRLIREDNAIDSSTLSADESDSRLADYTPASKKPKLTPATRKRNPRKSTAASESTLDSQAAATSASTSHSPPPVTGSSTYVFHSDPPSSAAPGQNPPIATRIGTTRAMRATLPIPVPNLTKKSRGRRVPVRVVTTTGDEIITNPAPVASDTGSGDTVKDKRSYVCSVEGCGKCFHRGEHLKRHIRSIHTHEKPFKCTYPECDKNFNRHDNLLQHLKVHKQAQATAAMTSRSPVVLLPNGKAKSKGKSKGSKGPPGKGRKKKRRSSSEDDDEEDGESEAEQDDSDSSASSEDDDVDEASAVSNLLSLRANPPLKGSATLIAPLHHNLTSSYHTLSSSGSMSSTATLIGSSSGWGYPAASSFSFSHNASSLPGSKPLYHPSFSSSFADSYPRKPYVSSSPSHSSFSLSKAYSSGPTTYESSAAAAGGTDVDMLYSGHGHVHDMMSDMRNTRIQNNLENSNLGMGMGIDSKRNSGQDDSGRLMFQSNMAMSSLRSTSSALRSTNGQNPGKTVIDMDIGRPFDRDGISNDVDPSGNGVNGHGHVSTKDAVMDLDVSNRDMTSGGGTDVRLAFHPGKATTTTHSDLTNPATVDVADPSGPKGFSGLTTTNKVDNVPIRPDSESAASSGPGPELSLQQQQRQGTDNMDQPMSSRMMLRPVGSEQDWKL